MCIRTFYLAVAQVDNTVPTHLCYIHACVHCISEKRDANFKDKLYHELQMRKQSWRREAEFCLLPWDYFLARVWNSGFKHKNFREQSDKGTEKEVLSSLLSSLPATVLVPKGPSLWEYLGIAMTKYTYQHCWNNTRSWLAFGTTWPGWTESSSLCVSQSCFFSPGLTWAGFSLVTARWLAAEDRFLLNNQLHKESLPGLPIEEERSFSFPEATANTTQCLTDSDWVTHPSLNQSLWARIWDTQTPLSQLGSIPEVYLLTESGERVDFLKWSKVRIYEGRKNRYCWQHWRFPL